jgi:ubiquinone/menaquinone biosynthesis C-methylase UbiE
VNTVKKTEYSKQTNTSEKLTARLKINNDASSIDFQKWLQSHIDVRHGDHVLDVACGTGAQSLNFLDRVGETGSVTAIDASETSIEMLRGATDATNLVALTGDMMGLKEILDDRFQKQKFDVISCSYALYYATDPVEVLRTMHATLTEDGRMAICVPAAPHSLVDLVRKFSPIPDVVDESLRIGPDVLEPFFADHFDMYSVSHLMNKQTMHDVEQVMDSLKNAAYYNEGIHDKVRAEIEDEIARNKVFSFFKKSFLIVGTLGQAQ